jgi:hypothetical protein
MTIRDSKIKQDGYLIAVSSDNGKWTFVTGDGSTCEAEGDLAEFAGGVEAAGEGAQVVNSGVNARLQWIESWRVASRVLADGCRPIRRRIPAGSGERSEHRGRSRRCEQFRDRQRCAAWILM